MAGPEEATSIKSKIKSYALYAFIILLFGPAAIIWVGGFFFGEAIVDLTDSKIFGHWFMLSLMAMAIFVLSGNLAEQFKKIKQRDKTNPSSALEVGGSIIGLIVVLYFLSTYLEKLV